MNEKFWKMTHPKSEEEKARERAAAANADSDKVVERSSPPQKERSAPPPQTDSVQPPPPPDTASISGGSPNKFGLGVRTILPTASAHRSLSFHRSLIDYSWHHPG